MKFEVYGKEDCGLCKSAMKKLGVFMERGEIGLLPVDFMDMETEHGAAEGDFFDVFEIPTVLLKADDERLLARWDGKAPSASELRGLLECDDSQCAAA